MKSSSRRAAPGGAFSQRPAASPESRVAGPPGVSARCRGAAALGNTDQTLCDRIARESGWAGLTFTFRGTVRRRATSRSTAGSPDVRAAVDVLPRAPTSRACGSPGSASVGTLAILTAADRRNACAASRRSRRRRRCGRGCANRVVPRVRTAHGVLRTPDYPSDLEAWIRAIANLESTRGRAARPAPTVAARARQRGRRGWSRGCRRLAAGRAELSRAATTTSEPRRMTTAMRTTVLTSTCVSSRTVRTACATNPRAIAALLGWLDRQEP